MEAVRRRFCVSVAFEEDFLLLPTRCVCGRFAVCVGGSALDCLTLPLLVARVFGCIAGSALGWRTLALLLVRVAGWVAGSTLGCLMLALRVDRVVVVGSALGCLDVLLVDLVRRGSLSRAMKPPGDKGCDRVRILDVGCCAAAAA